MLADFLWGRELSCFVLPSSISSESCIFPTYVFSVDTKAAVEIAKNSQQRLSLRLNKYIKTCDFCWTIYENLHDSVNVTQARC